MEESIVIKNNRVHKVLAHSYFLYLGALVLGLILDYFFPHKLFSSSFVVEVGVAMLGFATALVVWAQMTSLSLDISNLSKESFLRGPYRVSRTPTHWGLFMLVLSFGIISNSLFILTLSFVSFVLTKFIFVKKQEAILAEKYGQPYLEYKKSVKL